jgi:TolB protein
MRKSTLINTFSILAVLASFDAKSADQIEIEKPSGPGNEKPVLVSISGINGEALQVLQFDLYVQGFNFTNAEAAQFLINGRANGNFQASATDKYAKSTVVSHAYSGESLRRQVHQFVDDFVTAASQLKRKPICRTKIAFKGETRPNSEVFVADFDGHNTQSVTKDGSIVAAPEWVSGRMALYYTSYKLNHADILYHNLSSGERKMFARYGGSNMSPAPSPDGSKVAMILSKDGWTDLYVQSASGGSPVRLTKSREDESSPCWSPNGQTICYASKDGERRALRKISAGGGSSRVLNTAGLPNPTEPDWSPDGKWIAFTSQTRGGFQICVVGAEGNEPTGMGVEGEDASWAPNSRTLIFGRRTGDGYILSLLDVPTKQVKDVSRISGSNSQSQPSWAK